MPTISENCWRYHDGFWETIEEYYNQSICCPGCKVTFYRLNRITPIFDNKTFNFKKNYWELDCPDCKTKIRMFKDKKMVGTL